MIWHELERRTEALIIVWDYGMTFSVPLLGRLRYGMDVRSMYVLPLSGESQGWK